MHHSEKIHVKLSQVLGFCVLMLFGGTLLTACDEAPDAQGVATSPPVLIIEATQAQRLPSKSYILTPLAGQGGQELPLKLEVANTPQTRATGMMWRTDIPENTGMLFVWPQAATQWFWMKNTLVPLDMLFIQEGEVRGVVHSAEPKTLTPRGIGDIPVDMVLELAGGMAQKHGITKGWQLQEGE